MATSLKVRPRATLCFVYNSKSYSECCLFPKKKKPKNRGSTFYNHISYIVTEANNMKLCDTCILSIKAVHVMSCLSSGNP